VARGAPPATRGRVWGGGEPGGFPPRRAVIRWSRRMFRREWRQQLLVLTMLTLAAAAAIASITLVYKPAPADNKKSVRTIEVLRPRSVPIPGSVESLDYRAQDPKGVFASELLAVRQGRYPNGQREVAVTDGVAKLLRLKLGSTLALDGHGRTVVGIVENPRKLSDEFALVSPSSAGTFDAVTVLVDASS